MSLDKVRNFGIMAHVDAGKTTLSERILYYTGATWRMGEVHEGTATMDWMVQEQERGITITSAATNCTWDGHRITLVDMPGHIDFTVEVERCLRVLDGAVAVFCGVDGIQAQTEAVWRQAAKYRVPVVAFVNKMDLPGADFGAVLEGIRARLGVSPLPVTLPWQEDGRLLGVVDLVAMEALAFAAADLGKTVSRRPIPASELAAAGLARRKLVECLAEIDETVLEAFLEDREPAPEQLWQALRKACLEQDFVPVVCGSALGNQGVQPLLDVIVRCLPSPLEARPIEGREPETEARQARKAGDDQPFAALIFKIMADPKLGHIAFLRIYSGVAVPGMEVWHSRSGAVVRLGRLLQMHANCYDEAQAFFSGDIGALAETPGLSTGDSLCDPRHPVLLETARFPEPVVTLAVEPRSSQERDRLMFALRDLAHQDPTFRIRTDGDTGQTVLAGMGELHLEILLDRLEREYGVKVNVGRPQVARRMTVSKPSAAEVCWDRMVGPRHQFGSLVLKVEPQPRGHGVTLDITVSETLVPREFHAAIRRGILSAAEHGSESGHPLADLHVSVLGGSSLDGASDALDFEGLAAAALAQAVKDAEPRLLEPVMRLEVDCPPEHIGDVLGDIAFRRGQVTDVETQARTTRISALVPLPGLSGYATALRSLTSGRAVFISEFACFAEASGNVRNRTS